MVYRLHNSKKKYENFYFVSFFFYLFTIIISMLGATTTVSVADSNQTNRSVRMVTPMQANSTSLTGLTPIVVSSQGQNCNNLTHIIASTPQITGKVNLSFT